MNLPGYNFLSAPLWLITTLHIVTLSLHFVAMNFMVGGVIIVLFGKFQDRWNHPVVKQFVRLFPTAMAATVTLGVAPLLFVQLVYHRQIYAASIVSGWYWLGIIGVAIIAYYALYASAFAVDKSAAYKTRWLILALICFGYISFIYSSVFAMAEHPNLYKALYASNQSGLVINPEVGSYIFRWLHMIAGAVTVGGFFVGLLGSKDETAFRVGKGFFLWGMAITMVFGLGYLFTLGDAILPLMKSAAIWVLLVAIILSLGSLHFFFKKKFLASGLMVLLSLIGMVTVRQILRIINLESAFEPSSLPVQPQWSVFGLFLLFFVIMLLVLWYMLKLFFAKKSQTA